MSAERLFCRFKLRFILKEAKLTITNSAEMLPISSAFHVEQSWTWFITWAAAKEACEATFNASLCILFSEMLLLVELLPRANNILDRKQTLYCFLSLSCFFGFGPEKTFKVVYPSTYTNIIVCMLLKRWTRYTAATQTHINTNMDSCSQGNTQFTALEEIYVQRDCSPKLL